MMLKLLAIQHKKESLIKKSCQLWCEKKTKQLFTVKDFVACVISVGRVKGSL